MLSIYVYMYMIQALHCLVSSGAAAKMQQSCTKSKPCVPIATATILEGRGQRGVTAKVATLRLNTSASKARVDLDICVDIGTAT